MDSLKIHNLHAEAWDRKGMIIQNEIGCSFVIGTDFSVVFRLFINDTTLSYRRGENLT